ncbi:toxin VasX [Plesiomonas shigelloides]|uniref:toxin VasX n=1 Tax=Plesiomonas shigelloides TaxID=703 RepID=UPI00387EED70
MSSPNQDVSTASCIDAKAQSSPCPLKKNKIQLLPVRYALVEQEHSHPAIASTHKTDIQYRPIGIRLIDEESYLYLIHSKRPDIIYAYELGQNGLVKKLEQTGLDVASENGEFIYQVSESTIVVSRSGSIQALYSPVKISSKLQGQLLRSAKLRKKMMQTCELGRFDCQKGAPHLLPPSQLEQYLADINPQHSTNEEIDQWCWLKQKPVPQNVSVLTSKILPNYQNEAAVLLLEDPIGIMTELASAYQAMLMQEEEWMAKDSNRADYFAASQILQLIEMSDELLLVHADNKDALNKFNKAHPHVLEARYRDYWQAKQNFAPEKYNMKTLPYASSSMYVTDTKEQIAYRNELAKNEALAKKIGISSQDLQKMFDLAGEQKKDLLYGESLLGLRVSRGILERIDEAAMRSWYKPAQTKITHWREMCVQLDNDRTAMLPAAYTAIPVFDKEEQDKFKHRLELEYHWLLGLGEDPANREKISEFFATLGEQNTQLWVSNAKNIATVEDYDGLAGDINNAWSLKESFSAQLDGLSGLKEFQDQMAGVHLVLIKTIPQALQASMGRLASEIARLSIPELQNMTERMRSATAQVNAVLHHAKPGIVALLLGHAKNAGVTLDIGSQSDEAYARWQEGTVDKLQKLRTRAEEAKRVYNKATKNTPADSARRAWANGEWAALQRESAALREQLFTHSQPLAEPGAPKPRSHIIIKASDATLIELEEHLRLSREALNHQVIRGSRGTACLGVVAIFTNWLNYSKTVADLEHKDELTLAQTVDYLSAITGLVGASLALSVEVIRVGVYLRWLNTGAESLLKTSGKVVTIGTAATAWIGAFSATTDGYKQASQIARHWRRGEWEPMLASTVVLAGDGMVTYASGKIALAGGRMVMAAVAGEISWQQAAAVTLRFAVRFNPTMWVAAALIFTGELAYNFLTSTPLMRWISESRWGKRGSIPFLHTNQEWDYTTQLRKWLEVMQTPRLQVQYGSTIKIVEGKSITMPVQNTWLTQLRIVFPMSTPDQVRILALVLSNGKLVDITKDLRQKAPVQDAGLYTRLDFDWPVDDQGRMEWLYLVIAVTTSAGVTLFDERGGLRFSLNLRQLQGLEEANLAGDVPGWRQAKPVEEDDKYPLDRSKITALLRPLLN